MEIISQIMIGITGVTAIYLLANKNIFGFLFNLISQPFWFYTTLQNKQYGMFILSVVYTIINCIGIYKWSKTK